MNPIDTTADSGPIPTLIARLDMAVDKIKKSGGHAGLEVQAMTYAGFLSDLEAGRITPTEDNRQRLLGCIAEFCGLVIGEPTYVM